MAKRSGLGMNLYVSEFNVSGDIQALGRIGGGPAYLDMTAITQSAMERKGGKRDGGIAMTTFFNPAPAAMHQSVIPDLPTADQIITATVGTALGSPAASLVCKTLNYDPTRDGEGNFTFAVDSQANAFGLEWGTLLTAGVRTDTGATNGTGVDFLASSAFDAQAYLHVFAFTGTSAVVAIQESSDDVIWNGLLAGAFTTVTGATKQRIGPIALTSLQRFLRVITTGTFSNLQFAVSVVRNQVATVF